MKLLITGASGLLGANLSLVALDAGHELATSSLENRLSDSRFSWRAADLTALDQTMELVESAAPDWIVNCAAATDVDRCEREPQWAMALNRDAAGNLALAARRIGCRLIHISTDAVFDGERDHYSELDEPHPINMYGTSKLAGERAVLDALTDALVVRTNLYGWGPPGRASLAEWFLTRLQAGLRSPGFTDVVFCPLLVNQLSELLVGLTETQLSGQYHVAADDRLSKYEFGRRLAIEFGYDPKLVVPAEVDSASLVARRPKNLTLEVRKIERDLGVKMPAVVPGIVRLKQLQQSGHRDRVRGLIAVPVHQSSAE